MVTWGTKESGHCSAVKGLLANDFLAIEESGQNKSKCKDHLSGPKINLIEADFDHMVGPCNYLARHTINKML